MAYSSVKLPSELQSVEPQIVEPSEPITPETYNNAARAVLASLPQPEYGRLSLENRELQLVFRHDCLSLGCLEPQCPLCQHNPHRRCCVNFAPKYLVNDVLKAKCTAIIRVELIDRATGRLLKDEVPDMRLEICVLDGALYDCKFLEAGQLVNTGNDAQDDLVACALLINKKKNTSLLVSAGGGNSHSSGGVSIPFVHGKAVLPDLSITDSSEAILSGRKPPFRLLVTAEQSGGAKLNIRHAVSEPFVVATRRTRGTAKVEIPSMDDHVSKLEHMGKETIRKLLDISSAAQQAHVEIIIPELNCVQKVRDFKQLVLRADEDGHLRKQLQHVLKLSKDKWEEARDLALRAIVPDSRMRAWRPNGGNSETGVLFLCRLGNVDLDRPVGLLQSGNGLTQTLPVAHQTPSQRELLRRLQPQAADAWWTEGHPGWEIFPLDSDQFEQTGNNLGTRPIFASDSPPAVDRPPSRGRAPPLPVRPCHLQPYGSLGSVAAASQFLPQPHLGSNEALPPDVAMRDCSSASGASGGRQSSDGTGSTVRQAPFPSQSPQQCVQAMSSSPQVLSSHPLLGVLPASGGNPETPSANLQEPHTPGFALGSNALHGMSAAKQPSAHGHSFSGSCYCFGNSASGLQLGHHELLEQACVDGGGFAERPLPVGNDGGCGRGGDGSAFAHVPGPGFDQTQAAVRQSGSLSISALQYLNQLCPQQLQQPHDDLGQWPWSQSPFEKEMRERQWSTPTPPIPQEQLLLSGSYQKGLVPATGGELGGASPAGMGQPLASDDCLNFLDIIDTASLRNLTSTGAYNNLMALAPQSTGGGSSGFVGTDTNLPEGGGGDRSYSLCFNHGNGGGYPASGGPLGSRSFETAWACGTINQCHAAARSSQLPQWQRGATEGICVSTQGPMRLMEITCTPAERGPDDNSLTLPHMFASS